MKRSKVLIVATVLATLYAVYLICYFMDASTAADTSEAVGGMIATALVTPHMAVMLIGAIFGWLGVFLKKTWAALVAAILYAVAAVLFFMYIMFSAPILILGFVGYANQKKINNSNGE